MMRLLLTFGLLLLLSAGAAAQMPDLIISEYVEGSGDNKALEIYNGTSDAVNLNGYAIERYANGATVPVVIDLTAVDLQPDEVFVVVNPLADPILLALSDQSDANLVFNGDDALVLAFGGQPVDSIGRVGEDPGDYWACLDGNTQNHTLRRLSGVCQGDVIVDDPFDPCLEWSFAGSDDFLGIGHHTDDCGSVPIRDTGWGELKALFR